MALRRVRPRHSVLVLAAAMIGLPTTVAAASAADTSPPTTPADLRVVDRSYSTIDLEWDASTDNVGVTLYRIYDGDSFVDYTTETRYGLWKLPAGTTFDLRVVALDAAGNVSPPSTVTTQTLTDTERPTNPQNIRLAWQTATAVSLTWTASVDNDGGSGWLDYLIQDGSQTHIQPVATTRNITGLQTNQTHTFTVRARDRSGNLSEPAELSTFLENVPPSTPANLRVIGTANGQAVLGWDPSSDNSGQISRYTVHFDGTVAQATGTTLRISDLVDACVVASGETYTFKVVAHDPSNNISPPSNTLTLTVN